MGDRSPRKTEEKKKKKAPVTGVVSMPITHTLRVEPELVKKVKKQK